MQVQTSRFGVLDVLEKDIITFPEGILGFSKIKEYFLLERSNDLLFLWLQALHKPNLAFAILEPQIFDLTYQVEINEEDQSILELKDIKDIKVFSIITIPHDYKKMTANLKAPIFLNIKNRKARQTILESMDYPIRRSVYYDVCAYSQKLSKNVTPYPRDLNPLDPFKESSFTNSTYTPIHIDEAFGKN